MLNNSALLTPAALFSSIRSEMLDRAMITERAGVIGSGAFGVVIDTGRDSVLKVLRRFEGMKQDSATKLLYQEMMALSILRGDSFDGIQTPAIMGEPVYSDNPHIFAAFEMSKLSGISALSMLEDHMPDDAADIHYSVGSALGRLNMGLRDRFEEARANLPIASYSDGLAYCPLFSDEINYAFERLRMVLEQRGANDCNALVHGDFHLGNVMVNEGGRAIGVIDWSDAHVGHSLTDLSGFDDEKLSEVWAGYRAVVGKEQALDDDLLAVARIVWRAGNLKIFWDQADKRDKSLALLHSLLERYKHLTGYSL